MLNYNNELEFTCCKSEYEKSICSFQNKAQEKYNAFSLI